MKRRSLFAVAASAALVSGLLLPLSALAQTKTLKVVPHANITILDPVWTTAFVTRNHGYMIYDTLFGTDLEGRVKPQMADTWSVAGRTFRSRLIVGTGKYKDYATNAAAARAAGAEIVTVAVRRVNLTDPSQPLLVDYVKPTEFTYLPNTAGCFTGEDAVRTLRLAREAGGWDLVKLEVLSDPKTLFPDMEETLRSLKLLVADGFQVMVYCSDDPVYAKKLEEAGAVAIMPLGAPIGSGLGIQNRVNLRIIVENAKVPVLVDAGVGTASDAAIGMELGCDAILMNTAIAEAKDPIRMAKAMKHAVIAGREAYLAGRMQKRLYADPSSPLAGLI